MLCASSSGAAATAVCPACASTNPGLRRMSLFDALAASAQSTARSTNGDGSVVASSSARIAGTSVMRATGARSPARSEEATCMSTSTLPKYGTSATCWPVESGPVPLWS